MPVAALAPQRRTESVRQYAKVVAKPIVIISIGYCVLSSACFQLSADGALDIRGAQQAGLVTEDYALRHETDAVLFKQVGPRMFEFRVKRPILGYAGIPWLISHRTDIDLVHQCEKLANDGCTLRAD